MKPDLAVILQEILAHRSLRPSVDSRDTSPVHGGRGDLRMCLKEKGISDALIEDALFLYEVLGENSSGEAESTRPTRVLSSEEMRGLDSNVVGKLFRLYYLGFLKKEELETVMTDLLYVPPEAQNARARESVSRLMGVTIAQTDFIFDGGFGSPVVH